MRLEVADAWLVCATTWCAAAGMTIPLWQHPQAAGTPAGWPRPRRDGLPVPWITLVIAGRVWWEHLHGERRRVCQQDWLCQVCGLLLPDSAVVVVADGRIVSDTALHRRCAALAVTACPVLSRPQWPMTRAAVGPDDLLADGVPYRRGGYLGFAARWSLRPRGVGR
ncbi:hypothetical protein [Frankia sp. AvcI1]|uniref:hypothetical protein n=1 Tax=Frankia sp. AvcI1 TaxID=573496 RepID=UPI0021190C7E|nr:hypothetical protein [Frankia sp. AvcI1]